jgi:hypothetical protein
MTNSQISNHRLINLRHSASPNDIPTTSFQVRPAERPGRTRCGRDGSIARHLHGADLALLPRLCRRSHGLRCHRRHRARSSDVVSSEPGPNLINLFSNVRIELECALHTSVRVSWKGLLGTNTWLNSLCRYFYHFLQKLYNYLGNPLHLLMTFLSLFYKR